jgi:hypothetical protein
MARLEHRSGVGDAPAGRATACGRLARRGAGVAWPPCPEPALARHTSTARREGWRKTSHGRISCGVATQLDELGRVFHRRLAETQPVRATITTKRRGRQDLRTSLTHGHHPGSSCAIGTNRQPRVTDTSSAQTRVRKFRTCRIVRAVCQAAKRSNAAANVASSLIERRSISRSAKWPRHSSGARPRAGSLPRAPARTCAQHDHMVSPRHRRARGRSTQNTPSSCLHSRRQPSRAISMRRRSCSRATCAVVFQIKCWF